MHLCLIQDTLINLPEVLYLVQMTWVLFFAKNCFANATAPTASLAYPSIPSFWAIDSERAAPPARTAVMGES
jgi:hypothetical protein